MEIAMTVMKYNLDIVTFSSSHGGSPFYDSLMVGVRVNSLLSTPHELSQQIQVGLPCLSMPLPLYLFSHDSLCAGPPGLPLQCNTDAEVSIHVHVL